MKNGSGLGAGSRSLLLGTKALENPPSGENREDREREEEHSAAAVEPERKCGALQLLRRSARRPGNGREDDEGGEDEGEALHDHLKDQSPARRAGCDELREEGKEEDLHLRVRDVHDEAAAPELHGRELDGALRADGIGRVGPCTPGKIKKIGGARELDRHEECRNGRDDGCKATGREERLQHQTGHEAEHDGDARSHAVDGALREHKEIVGTGSGRKQQARAEECEPDGEGHDEGLLCVVQCCCVLADRAEMHGTKKPAAGYGKRLGPAALRGNSKLHIARASPVEPGGNDATRELEREAQVLA